MKLLFVGMWRAEDPPLQPVLPKALEPRPGERGRDYVEDLNELGGRRYQIKYENRAWHVRRQVLGMGTFAYVEALLSRRQM